MKKAKPQVNVADVRFVAWKTAELKAKNEKLKATGQKAEEQLSSGY